MKTLLNTFKDDGNNICSTERKYIYLEQLRDYIYKDVVLADQKAGYALTIVTVSVVGAIALFKEPNAYWIIGLMFASISVLCSMLTVLPRSYVTHEMVNNPNHWVNLKSGWRNGIIRRYKDAYSVLFENLWQKQTKGTTDSLKRLLTSGTEVELLNTLNDAMQRAFIAQTLKYLWVGKALLFAFLAFCFIGMSLLLTIDKPANVNSSSQKESKIVILGSEENEQSQEQNKTITIKQPNDSIKKVKKKEASATNDNDRGLEKKDTVTTK